MVKYINFLEIISKLIKFFHIGPRNIPPQYRHPPPHMFHRGSTAPPPARMRVPAGLPVYHHHTMDSSPSGGEVTTAGTPLTAEEAIPSATIPAASGSPHGNKNETPPPPVPPQAIYARPPPMAQRFTNPAPVRHPMHTQPPPRMGIGYQPPMQPNYYGGFVPPNEDNLQATSFQYGEFSETDSPQETPKGYEEETGGEFGGLVSYFSSQQEDDLDT